jgi:mRNA-degrading endonuclease RelE of RelBE toxin-antitoxin system
MAYQILTLPAAHQALKKLPREVREHILQTVALLKDHPQAGKQLDRPWRTFRSLHTKYKNTQYRIVYEVGQERKIVVLRYAGSRENFYKELRRLRLKPLAS